MNSRKSHSNGTDAFALREFVERIVDTMQPAAGWKSREEGIAIVEEILLEGRACGFETREGFEELCRTSIRFRLALPFSGQIRQTLSRAGISELQRVEGLCLCLVDHRGDGGLPRFPRASSN